MSSELSTALYLFVGVCLAVVFYELIVRPALWGKEPGKDMIPLPFMGFMMLGVGLVNLPATGLLSLVCAGAGFVGAAVGQFVVKLIVGAKD